MILLSWFGWKPQTQEDKEVKNSKEFNDNAKINLTEENLPKSNKKSAKTIKTVISETTKQKPTPSKPEPNTNSHKPPTAPNVIKNPPNMSKMRQNVQKVPPNVQNIPQNIPKDPSSMIVEPSSMNIKVKHAD